MGLRSVPAARPAPPQPKGGAAAPAARGWVSAEEAQMVNAMAEAALKAKQRAMDALSASHAGVKQELAQERARRRAAEASDEDSGFLRKQMEALLKEKGPLAEENARLTQRKYRHSCRQFLEECSVPSPPPPPQGKSSEGPRGKYCACLCYIVSLGMVGGWGCRAKPILRLPCSALLCSTPRAYRRRALLPAASGGSSRGAPTGPLYSTVMILMTEAEPMRWRAMTFWPFVQ